MTQADLIVTAIQVVTPTPPEWAVEHHKWLSDINNRKRAEMPPAWTDVDRDKEGVTAQQWEPADRITDADRAHDTKSLWRCLEHRLYFVVRRQGVCILLGVVFNVRMHVCAAACVQVRHSHACVSLGILLRACMAPSTVLMPAHSLL